MPKNPHPPRGGSGGSKKPAVSSGPSGEDTSFIVFTNAKGDPKKGRKNDNSGKAGQVDGTKGKGKGKEAVSEASDAPKRPDTRTLIGGASWTGKLPVNMLSEHCQREKWDKPEYNMKQVEGGFQSSVTMKKINPKTKETSTLPTVLTPPSYRHLATQPTAVEARHFAAAYTLFRVANMKNIHMMMPPTYKDLWKGPFQDMKKEAVKEGNGWMYEADPFQALKDKEDAKIAAEKKRQQVQKQNEKREIQPGLPGNSSTSTSGSNSSHLKGWTRVPKIDLGRKTRLEMESLIRKHGVWNPHKVPFSNQAKAKTLSEVVALGFRKSHVEEALEVCKDREEVLEWLLIHVPEDDLPSWTFPEGYVGGITMASGNIKREAILKRLAASGYAAELCEEALDSQGGDESKAAGFLQTLLLQPPEQELSDSTAQLHLNDDSFTDPEEWENEMKTLEAIYSDRFSAISSSHCKIRLEVSGIANQEFVLSVREPFENYPNQLPIIAIQANLPAYIKLSIIRKALDYARTNFLGEPMVFNLIDWLEQEIPKIIEHPGRLSQISSAVSAADNGSGRRRMPKQTRPRPKQINWTPSTEASLRILADWEARQKTTAQIKMLEARKKLPAWDLQYEIVDAVSHHQVVIISGETGSGKSTQSIQFILDDLIKRNLGHAANIICTQPRRISALGLADRVSNERCSTVGQEVGYTIRGESKRSEGITKLTFVTTGVLLRRLQTSGGTPEDIVAALADVSHVVVDEVHERSLDTDFLLVLLRNVLKRRKDLRVILMSATLDADVFSAYFSDVGEVGRVEIQGRTYPVEDFYVDDVLRMTGFNSNFNEEDEEDKIMGGAVRSLGMRINYDFIIETVHMIDDKLSGQDGGILIFLPGSMEIDRVVQALKSFPNIHALPLHASLLPAEQRAVFPPAPKGKRKVIASTNVAETSITIEDIVAVIDTGRVKETSFDPISSMVKLEETWASRAAGKQRRGRAGRVRAGTCYKLFTRNTEATKMAERPEPEIRRVPLEQLCLSVKAMGIADVPQFLAAALTPPDTLAVEGAMELLKRIGALDGTELTALGKHISMMPADLRCAKLMIYGATFGCLEACLTIASSLTVRSPFVSPQNKREQAKAARVSFGKGQGDLIADLRAFETWSSMRSNGVPAREVRFWCSDNFLSFQTLSDISSTRSQYLSSLKESGFIPLTYNSSKSTDAQLTYNRHNQNDALLRSLIAGSFNPQTARIDYPDKKYVASVSGAVALDPEARTIKFFNQDNGRVFVHPSSTLFDSQAFPQGAAFMSYFTKMSTSKVFIRDLTPFNAYTALLFSGPIELDTLGRGLVVDGWARLRGWARIGVLVSRVRMLLDEMLARKIDDPSIDLVGSEIVGLVRRLVELDGMDM